MDLEEIVRLCAILLAAIAHGTLQVGLGTELLLYRAQIRSGKLTEKIRRHVSDYVSGLYVITVLFLAALGFFVYAGLGGRLLSTSENAIPKTSIPSPSFSLGVPGLSLIAISLIIIAFIFWFIYYKLGRTTELWLPRTITKYLDARAGKVTSGTEAFSLGLLAGFAEIPFSIILMLSAAFNLVALPAFLQPAVVLLYALIVTIPETVTRFAVHNGKTIVDIQRWRIRNKLFLKILTGCLFLVLAIYIIVFQII